MNHEDLTCPSNNAGFVGVDVCHTDDLGDPRDNVFVAVGRRP